MQRRRMNRKDAPVEEPPYAEAPQALKHLSVVVVALEGECFWDGRHLFGGGRVPATTEGSERNKAVVEAHTKERANTKLTEGEII